MKLFLVFPCFMVAALLGGCGSGSDDKVNTASIEQGDIPKPEKIIDANLILELKAHVNSISVGWIEMKGAQEYLVYWLEEGDLDSYTESTIVDGTTFSFAMNGQKTYQVWVEALNFQGDVINSSNKVTVTSAHPEAELANDNGAF